MTRYELSRLKEAHVLLGGDPEMMASGAAMIGQIIRDAERVHEAEDRYHDMAEWDAYPVNREAA